jgi:hypothetical protein
VDAPGEQELRAAYEAELSRLTSADVALQAAVSLLNIGGYRLGLTPPPPPGGNGGAEDGGGAEGSAGAEGSGPARGGARARDLEQVRDAIDGVRGLLPILERRRPAEDLRPLRDALSQLQLAYARETRAAGTAAQSPGPDEHSSPERPAPPQDAQEGAQGQPASGHKPAGPGPAEASGRLWVPGR